MPTISIFIRKDDLEKWQRIEQKSQWLHDALSSNGRTVGSGPANLGSNPSEATKQAKFQQLKEQFNGQVMPPPKPLNTDDKHWEPIND